MATNQEKLEQFFLDIQKDVRNNIPSVTGKTRAAIRINVGQSIGQLIGPLYIDALEIGRGPTKNRTPSSPTLRENILEWLKAKGLPNSKETESLSYAMSKKIHNEGTRLFRSGKPSGAISDVITQDRIDAFADEISDVNIQEIRSILLDKLNKTFTLKVT